MRPVVKKIIAIANDSRISDKNFRIAIKQLTRMDVRLKGTMAALDELHEEAVMETERDMFVH